ncbi:hypothetical protein COOONC_18955 [Cooperia oncophora]
MTFAELFQKIKKKLTIERRVADRAKSTRSQSTREMETNSKVSTSSAVVVRPRAGTEIVIERLRYSKSSPSSSEITDRSGKSNKKITQLAEVTVENRRQRSDSAPLASSHQARRPNPAYLSLLSTGSILAPTYRSRTATLSRPTFVKVTVE